MTSTPTPTPTPINLADLRQEYKKFELDESSVDANPTVQFQHWFDEAFRVGASEPSAMTLATVNASGEPSARIVLLKGVDDHGFVFYTNYESRKGSELAVCSAAALVFFWPELERQVRIEGQVSKVDTKLSDEYFASRPLSSRISACASPQSQVIASRSQLATRTEQLAAALGEQPARPAHWGGYRLTPKVLEFWQGRRSRLHDRVRYRRDGEVWRVERLAP
jgi:pyridoxamine 5'-phosphate oxidase